MKKIVALGAIAALACGMVFADEPAIDIKIAEFSGNAEVKWGMDLDAGQHGFTNSESAKLKVNLWNEGTKETEGDGVWADIQIKAAGKDVASDSTTFPVPAASVERAKLHFNDFYIDIRSGNTKVGEFKVDTAVISEKAWLDSVGLNFTQGIQAGYDADAFKFSVDFRSYKRAGDDTAKTKDINYTSAYGIKAEAGLKDNLVPGLTVDAGLSYNLSSTWADCKDPTIADKVADEIKDIGDHKAAIVEYDDKKGNPNATTNAWGYDKDWGVTVKDYHFLGYGVKAAYKLAIGDDGMFIKPSAGYTGSYETASYEVGTEWKPYTKSTGAIAAGVLFGWGDINKDDKPGVPFLDGDNAKKESPGVGVVAYIPLTTTTVKDDATTIDNNALKALIVPSFYLGDDKVAGLKAAAYGEIGLFNWVKAEDRTKVSGKTTTNNNSASFENETTAIAFAAGVSYGITLDNDMTVTPKLGLRYANTAYVGNGLEGKYSTIFQNLGMQNAYWEKPADQKTTYNADFFNLKAGVEVGGLIDATTFSFNYSSANLLNGISEEAEKAADTKSKPAYARDSKYYNVKLGTFDIGCKISL